MFLTRGVHQLRVDVLGVFTFDSFTVEETEFVQVVVNEGETQRSMLTELEVVMLGNDLQVGDSAFTLQQRGGDAVPVSFTTATSNGRTTATLTFSGANTEPSGSLVDGNYHLMIDGSAIQDSQGNNLDVDNDGTPAGVFDFGDEEAEALYRLFGDVDQNRFVNVFDLLGFRQTYLLMTGDASFDASFDFNVDGSINIFDLLRFRGNWLKTLPFDDGSKRSFSGTIDSEKPGLKSSSKKSR